jgi:hypothetical protein
MTTLAAHDLDPMLDFEPDVRDRLRAKILSRIAVTDQGCWEYQGRRSNYGYCSMEIGDKGYRVHRIAYSVFIGPFAQRLDICHSCDNPPCCNPAHLFAGTHRENMLDAGRKGRLSKPGLRGEAHPLVSATDSDVRSAIRRRANGETYQAIADAIGVSPRTVANWVAGTTRGVR